MKILITGVHGFVGSNLVEALKKAHDTKNQSAADVYFKVNTGLTQKIFDWFLAQPSCKKFIQFSTVKSAADRVEGGDKRNG